MVHEDIMHFDHKPSRVIVCENGVDITSTDFLMCCVRLSVSV